MKILAADLSSHVGYAVGEHDAEPRFGTFDLPKTGDDVGRFVFAFNTWLDGMIRLHAPELYVFEAPLLLGGGKTSIATTRKLMALASHSEFVAFEHDLQCREANVMTVKKFFAGNGRAQKSDMMLAAQRFGFKVSTDDEADALALWSYTVHARFPDQRHRWALGQMGAAA